MCLRFLSVLILLAGLRPAVQAQAPLRICADPDNLPFSDRAGRGYDQRIASLVARDLHRAPVFVWSRSRRGFLREQFNKGACDMLLGVPEGMRGVSVSDPYYASSYVFVTRSGDHLRIASFTDPRLNGKRIGLQILEEDLSPPSIPLIRAGHAPQLVGFESFGAEEGSVVQAVASGKVGLAVVWGPVAGYYAARSSRPLSLTPATPRRDVSGIPFAYAMGFGVHKGDKVLLDQINASLKKLKPQIDRVLAQYHVPVIPPEEAR